MVLQPAFVEGTFEPPEEHLRSLLDDAVLADQLGFDTLWVTEHHFQPFGGLLSAPPVFLAAVSQRTRQIRLGVSVAVLPLHDPLRLAEEWATLDILSGGRVEFGIGRGFSRWEYRNLGIPQYEDRERRLEALDVILQAWTHGRVSFQGRYYQYDDVAVLPRPAQRPHPPIWVAAGSEETTRWAAERGYHLMIPLSSPSNPPLSDLRERVGRYRTHLKASGHPVAICEVMAQARTYVTDSDARAAEAERFFYRHAALARANAAPGTEDGRPLSLGPYADGIDDLPPSQWWHAQLRRGSLVAGAPDTCARILRRLQGEVGVSAISLNFAFGGMPPELRHESMRRFAQEVMPLLAEAGGQIR